MDPEAGAIPYKKTRTSAIAGAGHALYTTGADVLQTIKTQDLRHGLPFSIHMAEHEDETGMLMGEKTDRRI
jgi:cytosine/adenosine deaminase-related metal-dependent hydrolase